MSREKYKPSSGEIKKAEEMMTVEEKELSVARENLSLERAVKEPQLTAEELQKSIQAKEDAMSVISKSIEETVAKIGDVRKNLGLATSDEEAHSILVLKERLHKMQSERDGMGKDLNMIQPIGSNQPKAEGPIRDGAEYEINETGRALNPTEKQIGGMAPNEQATSERNVTERIKEEFTKELSRSLVRLSGEIQDFEDSLKLNKFNRISFGAENIRTAISEESIDFPRVSQVFDDLRANFKKDFMPRDEKDKLSIEPYNFMRVLDSLDRFKGVLTSVRSKIDKRPIIENDLDVKRLLDSLTKVITTIKIKMDDLEEVQTALRRYTR